MAIAALFFNTSALGTDELARVCGTGFAVEVATFFAVVVDVVFAILDLVFLDGGVVGVVEILLTTEAFGEGATSSDQSDSAAAKEPPVEAKLSSAPPYEEPLLLAIAALFFNTSALGTKVLDLPSRESTKRFSDEGTVDVAADALALKDLRGTAFLMTGGEGSGGEGFDTLAGGFNEDLRFSLDATALAPIDVRDEVALFRSKTGSTVCVLPIFSSSSSDRAIELSDSDSSSVLRLSNSICQ